MTVGGMQYSIVSVAVLNGYRTTDVLTFTGQSIPSVTDKSTF